MLVLALDCTLGSFSTVAPFTTTELERKRLVFDTLAYSPRHGDKNTFSHPEQTAGASARILSSFASFDETVNLAQRSYAKGDKDSAAVWSAIAAHIATSAHCGVFFSPRLERLLNRIGRELPDHEAQSDILVRSKRYEKVLHVCTAVQKSGGLTRMLSRWTNADRKRSYSLALTQHRGEIPAHVLNAVGRSGGQIYSINRTPGGLLSWAQKLRRIGRDYDAIVLHVHCEDVVPLLAFAEPSRFPPILFLNHADHLFWLGSSISHAVINLRDAAMALSGSRRGIPQERNLLVPTIVEPIARTQSREEAKRALGLAPEKTVLLSVARAEKYHTFNGVTYADRHVRLLQSYPEVELIVVGAETPSDWQPAIDACGGRIKPIVTQADPRPYYEMGDIYVDSYPFVSSTSMMEAAGYGIPLVTIFEAPGEARIFGINHGGLIGTAHVAHNAQEYDAILSRLISDREYRERSGAAARDAVATIHEPPGWLTCLDDVLGKAGALPAVEPSSILNVQDESPFLGEPDCRHQDMFRSSYPLDRVVMSYLGVLPLRERLQTWNGLRHTQTFETWSEAARSLSPEWIKRIIKK